MLRMLRRIAQKVGAEVDGDPAIAALKQAMRPDALARQIDRATGK